MISICAVVVNRCMRARLLTNDLIPYRRSCKLPRGFLLFVLCNQNQDIAIADVGTTIHANLPSSNETPKSRYNKNKLTYAYKLKNERLPHLNKHVYQIHVG